jgi:hypothetical protein
MSIAQNAKLLAKLFLDRRSNSGRSEQFAFGCPVPFGGYYRLKVKAPGFRKTVVLRRDAADIKTFERVFLNSAYSLRRLTRWNEILALYAAVASQNCAVQIANPHDEAWVRTKRVNSIGPKCIPAYSMRTLMELAPEAQPFIVKINIEGFESELFSRDTEWIKSFPIIIVGLHDFMVPGQGSSNNFLRRISVENRDFIPLGENIVSIANGGDTQ